MRNAKTRMVLLLLAALVYGISLLLDGTATIASPGSSSTQTLTGVPTLSRETLDQFLDAAVPSAMARLHVPGVTFVAVKDGEILTMRGFGYSDIEAGKGVDPATTVFRVASVSKVFTGMAVMQLAERGILDLDRDVNAYIKGFRIPATYPEPITLRRLLTHTAGFDERNLGMSEFGSRVYPRLGEYLAAELPPRIRPAGQEIQYSNHGVALAGYVVECASGLPFAEYVVENILAPLGMERSGFELTSDIEQHLSSSYQWRRGKHVKVPYVHINPAPAGSLMTTAADMAKFMMANLAGGELGEARVLGAEYVKTMQTQQFTNDPRVPGIGYAWLMGRRNGRRVVMHGGDLWEFSTQLLLAPDENLGLFVSGNSSGAAPLADELVKAFFDTFFPSPEAADASGIVRPAGELSTLGAADTARDPSQLAGAYRMTRRPVTTADKAISVLTEFRVAAQDDGTLTLAFPAGYGMPMTTWAPAGPGLYRDIAGDDLMAFDDWKAVAGKTRPSRMYIGTWAFERAPVYETASFTLAAVAGMAAVFVWAVLAWVFGRKVSGLAAVLGLVNLAAIAGIAGSLLAIPAWELTTAVPQMTKAALALPLAGAALALALVLQTIKRITAEKQRQRWTFYSRRTRTGLTGAVLPWLVIAADGAFIWLLHTWNLLGWRF